VLRRAVRGLAVSGVRDVRGSPRVASGAVVSVKRSPRNLRRGLHKLECQCGQGTYASWAQLERFGAALPTCSLCGDRFEPDHLELAMALGPG
jgi:hypothetical protein